MGKLNSLHVRVPEALFKIEILIISTLFKSLQILPESLKCKVSDAIYL